MDDRNFSAKKRQMWNDSDVKGMESVDQEKFGANLVAIGGAGNPENQVITAPMRNAQTATQNDDVMEPEPHQNSWTFGFGSTGWDVQDRRTKYILGSCASSGDACCEFGTCPVRHFMSVLSFLSGTLVEISSSQCSE